MSKDTRREQLADAVRIIMSGELGEPPVVTMRVISDEGVADGADD